VKDVGPESCGQPTPCWPSPALEPVLGKASQHLGLENGQPLCLLELNWGGTECVLSSTGRTAACFLPTSFLPTSPTAWLGPKAVCLPGRPGTTGLRGIQGVLLGLGLGRGFTLIIALARFPGGLTTLPFQARARISCCCLVESLPPCVGSVGQAECIGGGAVSMGLGMCELRPRCTVWRGVLWGKRCGFKVCVCRGWVG
uniref:Uncharacterized protein n=1 Tax=Macaca nemestrina TaxID=9545 RepID=A0A2K6DG77_MACNE